MDFIRAARLRDRLVVVGLVVTVTVATGVAVAMSDGERAPQRPAAAAPPEPADNARVPVDPGARPGAPVDGPPQTGRGGATPTPPAAGAGGGRSDQPARIPGIPAGLRGTPGSGQVRLCWESAVNADWYSIFHRDTTTGEGWLRMQFPVDDTCWTGNLFINGRRYEFRERGANGQGESGDSNVISLTPTDPRPAAVDDLRVEAGNASATLCWSAARHATGYVIYMRDVTAGEAWQRLPYPVNDLCWTGGLLTNGHTYQFKIRGGNWTQEGPYSNVVTVVPHA